MFAEGSLPCAPLTLNAEASYFPAHASPPEEANDLVVADPQAGSNLVHHGFTDDCHARS